MEMQCPRRVVCIRGGGVAAILPKRRPALRIESVLISVHQRFLRLSNLFLLHSRAHALEILARIWKLGREAQRFLVMSRRLRQPAELE